MEFFWGLSPWLIALGLMLALAPLARYVLRKRREKFTLSGVQRYPLWERVMFAILAVLTAIGGVAFAVAAPGSGQWVFWVGSVACFAVAIFSGYTFIGMTSYRLQVADGALHIHDRFKGDVVIRPEDIDIVEREHALQGAVSDLVKLKSGKKVRVATSLFNLGEFEDIFKQKNEERIQRWML